MTLSPKKGTDYDIQCLSLEMKCAPSRIAYPTIRCTGNHLAVPRDFAASTLPAIALHFIREIQEGIEGSGIKAGIIKVASDRGGITPAQECRR